MANHPDSLKIESALLAWGNSVGLRLNRTILEKAGLSKGSSVLIEATTEGIIIRPAKRKEAAFSEAELLAGMTPYLAHSNELPAHLDSEWPAE